MALSEEHPLLDYSISTGESNPALNTPEFTRQTIRQHITSRLAHKHPHLYHISFKVDPLK